MSDQFRILDGWVDNVVKSESSMLEISPNPTGNLESMFAQQEEFMILLRTHRGGFPEFPVDITSKDGQQTCREASLGGIEEWFEALKHLKNWKKHRASEVKEIDKAEFLEEMCDAMHYYIEVLLLAGISPKELFEAYMAKGEIIKKRITDGY